MPVILGGDFNCVMSSADRSGDSLNSSCFVGKEELSSLLDSLELVDCWCFFYTAESGHTWMHPSKGRSSRLDRIYVPSGFVIESALASIVFSLIMTLSIL